MYFNYMSYTVPSDRESKKKKKKKSPPLSPHSHTLNSLVQVLAYEMIILQLPSKPSLWIFLFDICFASPLKEELDWIALKVLFNSWSPLSPHRRWAQECSVGELWQSRGWQAPGSATWTLSRGHRWYISDNPLAKSRLSQWPCWCQETELWG